MKSLFRSFAGGEITPEMLGRLDLGKYQTGLALCRNFITLPHGPAQRRRGFQYIGESRDSTKRVRLIPFAYSAEQTAVLEFSHLAIRIFINGAALLEANKTCTALGSAVTCTGHGYSTGDDVFIGGRFVRITVTSANSFNAADRWGGTMNLTGATTCARVYTITSPYEAGDLFGLHYAQDSDVLTLVHPGYPAAELRRLGAVNWTLTAISFAPSAAVPTGVSVTPTIGTAGNESPQSYCVTAIDADGITESLASAVVSTSNNLAVSGNYNTVAWSAVAGASAYNVFKSRGGAFGFIGQTNSLSIVDDNVLPDTTKTPPQDIYTLNAAADQYPSAVTYHEQRRWFAGSNANPQTVWATRNGTQANLTSSLPSQDDDGLQFRIQARQQNAIRHLLPLSDLIALTVGGEFRIFADNAPAITPSTLSTKSQGASGASNVQPCITSGSILYAQAQGSRVREMAYNWQNNAFASIDISILAPHLFDGHTVVDMAYSRAPVQLLWCVRSDGALLGMSYVPEQQVYGWHQHDTAGFFESVCVVSEGLEDALYALVRREVDGREVRYIERLKAAFTAAAGDEDEEGGSSLDPHYGDTILILNCEQPDGSTTFIDTSPYANNTGGAGGPSVVGQLASLDGVNDYVYTNVGPEWDIAGDDVTIEVIANLASLPSVWTLITNRSPSAGTVDSGFILVGNSSGAIQGVVWGAPVGLSSVVIVNILSSPGTVTTGLHHFCLQRAGSTWTLAVDGAAVGTATSAAAMGPRLYDVQIGNDLSATPRHFHGGLRARVTRGVARYTFPFTPDFALWPDPT